MADQKTLFVRTARKNEKEIRGQAAVILEALDNDRTPKSIEQLAQEIGAEALRTRQDPERVVAYYLCIFKKRGLVVAERPVAAPETAEAEVAAE